MRNSFENAALESIDLDRMHERAKAVLVQDKINEKDFVEPYGDANVQADIERVKQLEVQFESRANVQSIEMKKVADIFEAIVLWNGEQSDWFGENAFTLKTSDFDDYVNGIDAVIEFRGEDPNSASYLGLATDVTFTSDTTKKFERLKGQIDRGELAKVKYFHSEHMNIHGQLSKLPEVIIGMDKGTVMELAEMWAEKKFKALSEHRGQIMILFQMKAQLTTFSKYADSIGKNDLGEIYRSRLHIIEGILSEKAQLANAVKYEINDQVHSSIMEFMTRWEKGLSGNSEKTLQAQ